MATLTVLLSRSSIWYSDGTIVLQAQNTQFLVHMSLLSDRSPIFKDMLSMPQGEVMDRVDKYPLVHISDSAEELTHFLHALYDPIKHLLQLEIEDDNAPIFCGILRLSSKYLALNLREVTVERLASYYPSKFDGFWRRREDVGYLKRVSNAVAMANALFGANALSLLPIALYDCSAEGASVLSGHEFVPELHQSILVSCSKFQLCFSRQVSEVLGLFTPDAACVSKHVCKAAAQELFRFCLSLDVLGGERSVEPFALWGTFGEYLAEDLQLPSLCHSCGFAVEISWRRFHLQLFDELPSIYRLAPSWQELKEMEKAHLARIAEDDVAKSD